MQKSTIVRAIRPIFKTLEAVAPRAGSVLAERLWCTVPRGKPVVASRPGERFTVMVNGRTVVAEAWGNGPAVYLMHGWGGRRGQLDPFVAPLVAAGHRVISLDAPGHGESAPGAFGSGRGLLTEFSDALTAVVAATGPAHGVIAHSLGAAATTVAILDGLPVEHAAVIAPLADPNSYTFEFAEMLGFGERIRTGFLGRLERRVGRPMTDFDVLARARETEQTPLPSLLVVHDREDREVYYRDGEELAMAWPRAELVTTVGLGHRRILQNAEVIGRVVGQMSAVRV